MISEMIVANSCKVTILRIIHILSVSLVIWVVFDIVICSIGEEKSVPGSMFLIIRVGLVTVTLVMSLEHGSLSYVHIFFGDHSWEGLKVGSGVPGIVHLFLINCVLSEQITTCKNGETEPGFEGLSCQMGRVDIYEIVNESVVGDDGCTALISLGSATNPDGKGPGEERTNSHIHKEGELILPFDFSLILPWPSLGAGHILSESVG